MRALKWVSLAVLLAACGNEAGTGEQQNAELPGGMTEMRNDDAPEAADAIDDVADDLRSDVSEQAEPMSSATWNAVEGAEFNAIIGTDAAEMSGEVGGSANASVRRDGDMYAFSDEDRAGRSVAVWTAGGVTGGGDIIVSFDLEGASGQDGWIGVTLSHRDGDDYARTHCAFSADGESATVISDNADGEAETSGSTMRCLLESGLETGDLDIYFYPTAYTPETGWTDSLTGEVFVSNLRLEARG